MAEAGFIQEAEAGEDMVEDILDFFSDRELYADDKMLADHDAANLPGQVSNPNEEDLYSVKVIYVHVLLYVCENMFTCLYSCRACCQDWCLILMRRICVLSR
jgi:hypothetical protein